MFDLKNIYYFIYLYFYIYFVASRQSTIYSITSIVHSLYVAVTHHKYVVIYMNPASGEGQQVKLTDTNGLKLPEALKQL